MVDVEYLVYDEDTAEIYDMVSKHFKYTGSKRARFYFNNWDKEKDNFWKIIPGEYRKALAKIAKEEAEKAAGKEVEMEEVLHG